MSISLENTPRKYLIDSKTLLNYQNRALFCISILSTITCIHYDYTKSPTMIIACLNIISVYCCIDIFLIKEISSKLHHLFGIFLVIYMYKTNVSPSDFPLIGYIFCKTEVSSIFLVLKYWLDRKTVIYKINLAAFYLSFLKMRVIDFYSIVSPDSAIYIVDKKYSNNTYMSYMLIGSMYGFYALYIYWFIQINMVLYKTINAKR
uniref:TLC domain-containing protein n=1 Tax=viral metagenome TaxID=1070528 RepID=A0A6C0HH89_9ZZZZ